MSFISYQTNKGTGQKYAYRCESIKDPITNKAKLKRTYLGKVDPISGQIIPKGRNGWRNTSRTTLDTQELFLEQQAARQKDSETIQKLMQKVEQMTEEQQMTRKLISEFFDFAVEMKSAWEKVSDVSEKEKE